jgi:CheY-like chemotaxis protein
MPSVTGHLIKYSQPRVESISKTSALEDCGVSSMDCEAAAYQAVWVAIRILVVDDNQHFRRQVGELFMLRGLEVVDAAADGKDALAAVVCACPDGVLLDINLPGRDGYSVAASLAAICPAATIVLTSSDVDQSRLRSCWSAALPRLYPKPTWPPSIFGGSSEEQASITSTSEKRPRRQQHEQHAPEPGLGWGWSTRP